MFTQVNGMWAYVHGDHVDLGLSAMVMMRLDIWSDRTNGVRVMRWFAIGSQARLAMTCSTLLKNRLGLPMSHKMRCDTIIYVRAIGRVSQCFTWD
ncbi:hypothetical protein SPHINGO391_80034 [Sphingomonas aurantiaca]|uniref:Uncharacterized protein n=1 Tax=Sphingomonas aurantiaca TaxID=185949 RepID=A0A5E8AMP6_9SPHN|nr:hypothetical protein SPHINGO391_80034 [Sphingomonas aurantiaca]